MATHRKLRTIIVEDEVAPRQLLRRLLERGHSDVIEIVAEADSGPAALALCEHQQPDVLFLDLHLPGFDGADLLAQLGTQTHVVITSGDAQLAVDTYRDAGLDCLVKPFEPERLREAVTRVVAAIANERVVRLLCRERDETKLVHTDDVLFLLAQDGYTNVQTEGSYYLLSDSLAAIESRLPDHFARVHRTTIVNIHHVTGFSKGNEFVQLGRSGHDVPVSRRLLREFRRKLMYFK